MRSKSTSLRLKNFKRSSPELDGDDLLNSAVLLSPLLNERGEQTDGKYSKWCSRSRELSERGLAVTSYELEDVVLRWSTQKGSNKVVLALIASYYNEEYGYSWPSIKTLAQHARLTERQVLRALRALEEHGSITIEKVPFQNSRYRLHRDYFELARKIAKARESA